MYRFAVPACLAVSLACVLPARGDTGPGLDEARAVEKAMQKAIQDAEPAVACILVSRSEMYAALGQGPPDAEAGKLGRFRPPFDKKSEGLDLENGAAVPESFGSGVVIDESGLVLTCEHVVRDATKIFVRLPGHKGSYADIHASDPRSDLAVLRLLDPPRPLKAIKMGDGGKAVKGQWVISLANPFAAGFRDGSPSASWGILSNIRRRAPGPANEADRKKTLHQHGTLLQTDARLNLGTSGGALLDLKGELIGLTTSLAAISGAETAGGFAVPTDAGMRRIIEVLKRGEEVEYGFLGVSLSGGDRRNPKGLQIGEVTRGSPAFRAGMRSQDTILSIQGTPIHDADDLFLAVGSLLAGTDAKVDVASELGGPPRTLTVTLAKFHVPGKIIASKKPAPLRGLRVDYTSALFLSTQPALAYAGVPPGVAVREVFPESKAATAQLRVNDVITHVNGAAVNAPADFYKEMQKHTGAVELRLEGRIVTLN